MKVFKILLKGVFTTSFICLTSYNTIALPIAITATAAETNTFAVYGDMPYGATVSIDGQQIKDEQALKEHIIPKLVKDEDIDLAIHVGDYGRPDGDKNLTGDNRIKSASCTYDWRKNQWTTFKDMANNSKTERDWNVGMGIFYTPGDNDWTDCNPSRLTGSIWSNEQKDPFYNLDKIRYWFFEESSEVSENDRMYRSRFKIDNQVLNQPSYPENQMWQDKDLMFVTVHWVGSNNGAGLEPYPEKYKERVKANLEWISKASNLAYHNDSINGLVIATHVDPFGEPDGSGKNARERCLANPYYTELCSKIISTADFFWEDEYDFKKVLFVHGDTYPHCLDQPFEFTDNVWRLNAAGDFRVIDADIVTFNNALRHSPFRAFSLLNSNEIPDTCTYDTPS